MPGSMHVKPLSITVCDAEVPHSMLKLIFSLLALSLSTPALFAADFLRPEATLERGDPPSIRLSITWAKLNANDLATLEIQPDNPDSARRALIRLLDICIVSDQRECGDAELKANYQDFTIDKTLDSNVYKEIFARVEEGLYFEQDLLDNTQTLRAQILLTTTGGAQPFSKDTKIATKLVYGTVTESDTDIQVGFAKGVVEAVQEAGVARSKKILTAYWKQIGNVAREGGGTAPASGMLAVLLPSSIWFGGSASIPTYVYNPDFSAPAQSSSCQLNADPTEQTCSLDCNAPPQVLDTSAIERDYGAQGARSLTVPASSSAASFNDLENGQPYAILLQYLPDGLSRACVVGTPSDAMILTEIATGQEPKEGDAACFIATAAYGSSLDARLDALRWFRDRFLLPYTWTRSLVRFYYKEGPLAAQFIADKPALRALVRGALWGPVSYLENLRVRPGLTLASSGLVVALILLTFAWLSRKAARLSI